MTIPMTMTQRKTQYIILLIILTLIPTKTEDNIIDNSLIISTHSQIISELDSSEFTFFAYYYKTTSSNSMNGFKMIKEINEKLKNLIKIMIIDCDQQDFSLRNVCKETHPEHDSFPRMVLFIPPNQKHNPYTKQKNSYTEKAYLEKKVTYKSLYSFITDSIQDYSINLTSSNIDTFLESNDMNKLILFTDKDKTPLLYRGLSSYFYDRLRLGIVRKDQKDLLSRFEIETYPTLLIFNSQKDGLLYKDEIIDVYNGELNADSIINAVEFLALKEKKYVTDKRIDLGESIPIKNYGFHLLNSQNFAYYLSRFPDRPSFMLTLYDDSLIGYDFLKLSRESSGFVMFYYLDCNDSFTNNIIEKYKNFECPSSKSSFNSYFFSPFKGQDNNFDAYIKESLKQITFTDYKFLCEMIRNLYKGNVVEVGSDDFHQTIKEIKDEGKTPSIYLHEDETYSIAYYLLSTDEVLLKKIRFLSVDFPSSEVKSYLKISKLPRFLLLEPSETSEKGKSDKVILFNEDMNYNKAKYFLKSYYPSKINIKQSQVNSIRDIDFIYNNKVFKKLCDQSVKLCVLSFLDGRGSKEAMIEFDKYFSIIEKVANLKKYSQVEFGWVNATCQYEFSRNFDILTDNLPRIVVILPSIHKYFPMFSSFEEVNIEMTIDLILKGKVTLIDFDYEKFYLRNSIDCSKVKDLNEKYNYDSLDDYNRMNLSDSLRNETENERKKEDL